MKERTVIAFKHILCPVDFSDSSSHSLDHALALARWYDSKLTVLHVVPTFEPVPVRGDLGYPIQVITPLTTEEVVAEMRRRLDAAGVPQDAVLTARAGDASTTIVDEAVTANADLIVMVLTAAADSSGCSSVQSRRRSSGRHLVPF
jgi:nucleotide-binding universal stress UspA family protein